MRMQPEHAGDEKEDYPEDQGATGQATVRIVALEGVFPEPHNSYRSQARQNASLVICTAFGLP